MKSNLKLFLALSLLWSATLVMGQATVPWQVPAAKKSVKNPVAVSPAVIEKGKSLYITHCKSCHGDPGKGNGLPLVPKPTDPASDKYQGQTDGEMFFKIQTGRGAMPKFAEVISDNDKWSIIHFVRSLKKKSSAGAGEIILDTLPADLSVASASLSGQPITLKLKYRDSDTSLIATLTIVNEEGETVPAPGVPVAFFIRRYFGNLPISEEVDHTNQEGRVGVSIPRNLPGDTSGMLHIFARIAEPDKFGAASDSIDAICGKPSVMVNITEERTLWGRSRVAPLYIIITFFGALLIVWGTMGYVVMNVMKIAKKEA